jgi:Protein of unknown function (DUF2892)
MLHSPPAMKQNIVLGERTARFGLGMFLLASPVLELPTYPYSLLGIVLIVTGLAGYCPLWSVLSLGRATSRPEPATSKA